MKTLISLITIFTLLTVKSYSQNSNVNALLEKQATRQEVINTILNNHEYMTEFIQAMHGNQHAMMMNGNSQMNGNNQGQMGMNNQNQMMGRSYMMNMMKNNPDMMQMMMGNMMDVVSGDSTTCHNFVNLMYSHPQMRQMMMQHLNNSNVAGADGK